MSTAGQAASGRGVVRGSASVLFVVARTPLLSTIRVYQVAIPDAAGNTTVQTHAGSHPRAASL